MCCVTKQPSGVQPPIYLFFIEEAFLDACKDDAIGAFHSPVGLGVVDRGEHEFGSDASAEFLERLRVELFTIIYRELLRYPEPAYYVLPKKIRTASEVIFIRGLASTHLVKYSMATTTYL